MLFLDEFTEFRRDAIEGLRQPLEDGRVVVTRMVGTVVFPARFTLVAAILQAMKALGMSQEGSSSSADSGGPSPTQLSFSEVAWGRRDAKGDCGRRRGLGSAGTSL